MWLSFERLLMLSNLVMRSFLVQYKDLKSLGTAGVFFQAPDKFLKAFCLRANNSGARGLAGFQESFIVNKCWRFSLTNHFESQ